MTYRISSSDLKNKLLYIHLNNLSNQTSINFRGILSIINISTDLQSSISSSRRLATLKTVHSHNFQGSIISSTCHSNSAQSRRTIVLHRVFQLIILIKLSRFLDFSSHIFTKTNLSSFLYYNTQQPFKIFQEWGYSTSI